MLIQALEAVELAVTQITLITASIPGIGVGHVARGTVPIEKVLGD